ncbi:MAG: hypothetical protein AAF456_25385 [Planctomycetota bacterium]
MRFQNIISSIANGFARTSVAGTEMLRNLLPGQEISGTQEGRHLPARMRLIRLNPLADVQQTSGGTALVVRPYAAYVPGTQGKKPAFGEQFALIGRLANAAISDVAGQSPRMSSRTDEQASHTWSLVTRCQQVQKAQSGKS